jgi:hypothetical protein
MTYRVVYGETLPAWEEHFPTKQEAEAFAKKQRGLGDIVFEVDKIDPNDTKPHSLIGAINQHTEKET